MYKLLIVDDESWVRERLRLTIDWNSLGISDVEDACDGEEGLKVAGEMFPDIIISDIRMPCVDGLEFLKRLREKENDAKLIIISGYSDFDYAKRAIRLGAYDYILKPIEDDDLINVVKKCVEELNNENKRKELEEHIKSRIKESLPILREKLFMKLIEGKFESESEITANLESLNIKFDGLNHLCFIAQVDDIENIIIDEKGWDKQLLEFAAYNITQDFVNKLGNSICFTGYNSEIIAVISSNNSENVVTRQVLSISNGIRRMVKRILGYSITIGIGNCYKTIADVSLSFREAKEALRYSTYLGKDKIYDIRSVDISVARPNYSVLKYLDTFLNNIRIGDRKNAVNSLENIIKDVCNNGENLYPITLKLLYIDIINSIFKSVFEAKIGNAEFSEYSLKFMEQLDKLQTADQILQWLRESVNGIIDLLERQKDSKRRKIVEMAISYIEENFNKEITLNSIADKLHLNASYFCKVFTDEMGESFTKYLMKLRIEKAKELMSDPLKKIYEISDLVGYENVRYFTKIFKEFEGVTPVQYREKIR